MAIPTQGRSTKIAKDMDLIDETRHYHNFIHDTKLKWSDEDRLWIDKVRAVFWWWMNISLDNEASGLYKELVTMLEAMSTDEWLDPETERKMWDLDDSLSNMLKLRGITHYTIPFKDRPEISILHLGADGRCRPRCWISTNGEMNLQCQQET